MNPYVIAGLAIAAAAAVAGVYRAGGVGPRAQLEQLKTEVAAAKKLHDAEDRRKEGESKTIIKEKDNEREQAIYNANLSWSAELDRVRKQRIGGADRGPQPTPIAASVCDGADGNARLSDALAKAERETRGAITDYQAGTGELLAIAQRQAIEWNNLKGAVAGLRQVNEVIELKPPQ